ncbi:MAG TPA: adenylate/guanylate cyclase domain-containing protein, partial [Gammaproteobacteria bacterium]|nr:adenylate/guanylate cyclase domain-containing protein [Gammaproteobacteria bacterium]
MARKKTRRTREAPREMAAVMFTDVHGYSSLAQRDEALAVRLLELKRTLADPLIAEHRGRLVKTIGDALMVEFKSALAAVRCATELQKRLHKHNKQVPEKERLIVRIGVHMGDVIRKDGDLLGDTVNIAARVEPQAAPGGIAVTQSVYDQIRGKFDLPLLSLGGVKLKGIDAEMPLYAVVFPWSGSSPKSTGPGFFVRLKQHHMFRIASWYATAAYVLVLVANAVFPDIGFTREDVRYLIGAVALGFPLVLTFGWMFIPPSKENPEQFSRWKRVRFRLGAVVSLVVVIFVALSGVYLWRFNAGRMGEISTKVTGTPSIVVLPFQKLGRVDDAMAADMQETIEDTFSNLGGLKVISHAALPPTLGSASALAEVFKVTGATLILQGSIEHTDAKSYYSVRMQLVSAAGAETLYSVMGEYAYDASSSDIAKQAAFSLAGPVRSLTLAVDGLTKGYATTKNQRALQLLRQALISFNYDDNGTAKAVTLLHEALAVDPNFAQAHAYLAVMEVWGGNDAQAKAAETEIAMAEKLAPGLPEAKLARGALQAWIYNDNAAADKTLESVQDTIGNRFMLHWTRAYVLRLLGRWDDALREYQTAEALDPYQPWPPESAAVLSFGKR